MEETTSTISLMEQLHIFDISKALLILIVGYFVAKIASNAVSRFDFANLGPHGKVQLRRAVFYGIFILMLFSSLRELGFDLSVVLGAAGILSVAIGFASQTSASNLISGIFLMMERPFSITDVIRVGDTTGEVISIDLLSVKLRTFDNLFVRIPNESMIKTQVTTLTKFPIRRADLQIGIAYKEDIEKVQQVLTAVATKNILCLDEPKPLFILLGFGSSSVNIQFSVWAKRENFLALKNTMYQQIKKTFDELGIEIPFPHLSIYSGEATKPMPVTVNATQPISTKNVNDKPSSEQL
ncbi:mechanosensitive ion channel family protein [Paraglaciecola arctica]|uniref:Small-conductance mechanosensitive channel n=1 Tax=Paraglaciecola arctica BSs20135 TaxID=493475 RepID=K6Y3A3_9ALTE|nr:mechanosensitive ion channel family protein [Paraglaciecola arctica]GAC18421.1 MscS Mechanosensitive ion channel [Paraglaciecola arctica BSs20135]